MVCLVHPGALYKVVEGSFILNISFSFSRKLRAEIEESFNWQACFLLFLSAIYTSVNMYMLWKIWSVYSATGNQLVLMLLVICIVLELCLVLYTNWLASMDCIISNSTCLAAFMTYCLYRFTMRSVEPECTIDNFTISNLVIIFFNSKLE